MEPLFVFKFGGASVKSAKAIRNLADILLKHRNRNLVVVISAMAKTTNALEDILSRWFEGDAVGMQERVDELEKFHIEAGLELVDGDENHVLISVIKLLLEQLKSQLKGKPHKSYDFHYDQIVSFGELLSTHIVSYYLNEIGISNILVDARKCIITDTTYRDGIVDEETSSILCQKEFDLGKGNIFITQGFIGGTKVGTTTTLGREGSDYTAAILANLLNAKDVTIWKDVEGVLNADPKIFSNTQKLDKISYQEAIELAYSGAQVIHPKTIKPLQNKGIPLYVKSFINPDAAGTVIINNDNVGKLPPILILKRNQVLISLSPRDFSFVIEDCLSKIFAILYKHRVKVNMIHNSAISFTVCVDYDKIRFERAQEELKEEFSVRYNSGLELLTVRHYTHEIIEEIAKKNVIYLQQRTRSTARFVIDRL
ncbi:aspartate kinase [Tenuifilum thalassicum]|uniref:Aspartokinase n=1 Tax=Tenuifilum thalassicum TaxID=2590900 RepID=A0A7D4BD94_9BACT|nr:aspartate kinase [Tenuifilum thalassicum]QKG79118.1 aspartate kinase [Tenuifilum thalassicum]